MSDDTVIEEQETDETDTDSFAPRFRVVRAGNRRRGIRLEEIFWKSLKEMVKRRGQSLGETVLRLERETDNNLSSALRVEALRFFREETDRLSSLTDIHMLRGHIQACPSPTFCLSGERKIIVYNSAFLQFIQSKLSRIPVTAAERALRLSLDMPFASLIESLKGGDGSPVNVGFAIGVEGQVVRGRLNAVYAPLSAQEALVGYIVLD